jgi:Polyketide cyclase / dehydrase and lipid transport.
MFKKLILAILAILAVYVVICAFGPKRVNVEASKLIRSSPENIFAQIGDLRNWSNWSKWILEDPDIKLSYDTKTIGVGGKYSWESKKNGNGYMTITDFVENKSVSYDIVFTDWESTSQSSISLTPSDSSTQVTWSMSDKNDIPFLMRGLMLVMNMQGAIKKDFEQGLNNLEKFLQNTSTSHLLEDSFYIEKKTFDGMNYLAHRQKISFDSVPSFFEKHFPALASIVGNQQTGAPCGIFWNWDEKNKSTDMAAALPIGKSTLSHSFYKTISITPSHAYVLHYYGAYDKTSSAYAVLEKISRREGYPHPTTVIEEYITDTNIQPDTNQWLTKIYYLVKN